MTDHASEHFPDEGPTAEGVEAQAGPRSPLGAGQDAAAGGDTANLLAAARGERGAEDRQALDDRAALGLAEQAELQRLEADQRAIAEGVDPRGEV